MSGTNPLQITDPNAASDNPLLGGTPSQGAALAMTGSAVGDWLAAQRAKSAQMGLWNPQTGLPTGAGLVNAAGQYGNALMMGTTAPGSPHFALDPYDLKPPDNLTPAQQGAVDHYSNLSMYMNEGEGPEVDALRGHLDAAIDKSRLSADARLYRGFSIPSADIENIKPGDVVPLSTGYVSTSTSKDVAKSFAEDDSGGDASVLAELRVPRGHPALHVPTAEVPAAEFGEQHEVLLPRNMQFRVHSINEKSDGQYEMLAIPEVTGQ